MAEAPSADATGYLSSEDPTAPPAARGLGGSYLERPTCPTNSTVSSVVITEETLADASMLQHVLLRLLCLSLVPQFLKSQQYKELIAELRSLKKREVKAMPAFLASRTYTTFSNPARRPLTSFRLPLATIAADTRDCARRA